MKKLSLLVAVIALYVQAGVSSAAAAQRDLYLYGGAPDRLGGNIFVHTSEEFLSLKQKGWNLKEVQFGGTRDEAVRKSWALKKLADAKPFNPVGFRKSLKNLAENIEAGTYRPNDQILLIFDTHGGPRVGKKIGGWVVGDVRELVSRSVIEPVIQAAEKKGVRLGILDPSCYSGQTLELIEASNKLTCALTGSNELRVGGNNFSSAMVSVNAQNLEAAFFEIRNETPTEWNVQPLISTEAGLSTQEGLRTFQRLGLSSEGATRENGYLEIEPQERRLLQGLLGSDFIQSSIPQGWSKAAILKDLDHYTVLRTHMNVILNHGNYAKSRNGKERILNWDIIQCVIGNPCRLNDAKKAEVNYQNYVAYRADFLAFQEVISRLSFLENALYFGLYRAHDAAIGKTNACREFEL